MGVRMSQQLFESWDAWILLSVIYATRSSAVATLTATIGMADYINHAILTRGELETGLRRLVDWDLLNCSERGFLLGEGAQELWATLGMRNRSVGDDLEVVSSFLGALQARPGLLPSSRTESLVSKEEYKAAVREYQRSVRASRTTKRSKHDA